MVHIQREARASRERKTKRKIIKKNQLLLASPTIQCPRLFDGSRARKPFIWREREREREIEREKEKKKKENRNAGCSILQR
jgi:hypothetical protein